MRTPTLLALSLASFAVLPACGRDAPKADPTPMTSAMAPAMTAAAASGTATSATTTTAAELEVGKPPPDFTATAQDGTVLTLSKLKGKPVVVYFYPKDETPGCTVEAKSFRDSYKDLANSGVTVIGISADTLESHKAFAKHHDLPFHLVSDESGTIAKTFGVPNKGGYLGRQTFVIGADGNVKKIYRDVDPSKHVADVMNDLKS